MLDREFEGRQPCPCAGRGGYPIGEGASGERARLRCRAEVRRAQAAYCRGYELAAAAGEPDADTSLHQMQTPSTMGFAKRTDVKWSAVAMKNHD